ncbi:MAG: NUDIX domain-containing protein [Dyadobacter sp.]|uniref:NUDIX hydrolase n=1 Tax=Dyadobacter sp. TaxID=1914288 RepID=UPI0032665AE5
MSLFNGQDLIAQVAIDCVIFGYQDKQLKVLINKLNFKGDFFSLPGGLIFQNESVTTAAYRILEERTSLSEIYLDQFYVFGDAERTNADVFNQLVAMNPESFGVDKLSKSDMDWITSRFISIGYYALVDINKVKPKKTALDQSVEWYNIKDLPLMIVDHNEIVKKGLDALRSHLDEKILASNLLPDTFTIKDLQQLYEAIFDKTFARNNFQRKILDLDILERLEKKFTGAQNKAPYLYRFKKREGY